MRAFVAVAETGQFSTASNRLGLSRAMASKQVMDLETHLGARLLNRTTRKVSLTEQGAAYLERCRDIFASLEEAEQEITRQASEPIGRMRVSAPMAFGASHLAPQVAKFAALYPRVGIDLILNDRLVDLVDEGYDLAIRIGRLADNSLVAKRIGEMQLLCCASPLYLENYGRPREPEDLSRHECILYSYASTGATWSFPTSRGPGTVKVSGRVTCNNGEAICQMAIHGLGVILQPDFIVNAHLASGVLEQLLTDDLPEPVGIYAIHQSRKHVPARIRSFIEFLTSAFSKSAPPKHAVRRKIRT